MQALGIGLAFFLVALGTLGFYSYAVGDSLIRIDRGDSLMTRSTSETNFTMHGSGETCWINESDFAST